MNKLTGLFTLLRFELPFSAGVCVLMGQLLTLGEFATAAVTVAGFLSIFCISASILVLNDYFDIETDRINAPGRPIPSGAVTPAEALLLTFVLLLAGIGLSWLLGLTVLLCAVGLLVIGFLYNRRFKKSGLPGNLLVSVSVGSTFIYGAISAGAPLNRMAWFFGVIAGLIDLGEEIAADAMDAKGDMLIGSRSLAIRHGRRRALITSAGIFCLVILISSLPFVLGWFAPVYLIPIAVLDLSIVVSLVGLLRSEGDGGRKHIRRLYLGATLGLVIFLLMRSFDV